jgi:hypothetical protein
VLQQIRNTDGQSGSAVPRGDAGEIVVVNIVGSGNIIQIDSGLLLVEKLNIAHGGIECPIVEADIVGADASGPGVGVGDGVIALNTTSTQ